VGKFTDRGWGSSKIAGKNVGSGVKAVGTVVLKVMECVRVLVALPIKMPPTTARATSKPIPPTHIVPRWFIAVLFLACYSTARRFSPFAALIKFQLDFSRVKFLE
jgi:hypothetical protein